MPVDSVALEPQPELPTGVFVDPSQTERASELATQLAEAQRALAAANDAARAAERDRQQAEAAAKALAERAAEASKRATASAAFATALVRSLGSHRLTADPLSAVLGTPGDLLTKLGAVDRLERMTASRTAALKAAATDAERAASLKDQAGAASGTVASIDVDGRRQAVSAAQAQVSAATQALESLPVLQAASNGFRALVNTPVTTATGWVAPVRAPLTDVFGPRPSRPAGTAPFHPGDDLGASCGSTIVAASAGTVVDAGPNGSYGNFVLIDHGNGVQTAYGHIVDGGIGVKVGQKVAEGQAIALVGSTGASTGCHLHFEVRVAGLQIDPQPFMAARGVVLGRR